MEKTVLVTGATGGIGKELCKLFAKDGHTLILIGRTKEKLKSLTDLLQQYSNRIYVILYDLRKKDGYEKILNEIKQMNLQIDIFVNLAGFGLYGEFLTSNLERQEELLMVNLNSLMALCYFIGKDMKQRNQGYIINFSSISAFFPGTYMASYYASKAFILSFSLALERELKPYHVSVLALCPGVIDTPFYKTAGADETKSDLLDNLKPDSAAFFARKAYQVIKNRKSHFRIIGFKNKVLIFISKFLPARFLSYLIENIQKPKEEK